MKLRPLGDRILVEQSNPEEEVIGGLVVPDTAKEKPQKGKVLAVGSGKIINGKKVALDVKKGDMVLFSKYGGDEIEIKGRELKILKEEDVLAIIE